MKISIITINYNNLEGLKKTFNSVINQKEIDIEYVIIDGNSTDGSELFLKENSNRIDTLIVEKDRGIYEAMNKGLKKSTGDFCLFLNSGDVFINDFSLYNYTSKIDELNSTYFSYAKIQSTTKTDDFWFVPSKSINKIDKWVRFNPPNHQSVLFPRSFYELNFYDLFYKISGDVDYIANAIKQTGITFIPIETVEFELGGISNKQNRKTLFRHIFESQIVRFKYYPNKILNFALLIPAKYLIKYLISSIIKPESYWSLLKINQIHIKKISK